MNWPFPFQLRTAHCVKEAVVAAQSRVTSAKELEQDQAMSSGLVHDHQSARLNFRVFPPRDVPEGQWFNCSVYLANEFGLWRRQDFPPPPYSLPLTLTATTGGITPPNIMVETQPLNPVIQPGGTPRTNMRVRFMSTSCKEEPCSPPHVHLVISVDPSSTTTPFSRDVLPVASLPIQVTPAVQDHNHSVDDDDNDIDQDLDPSPVSAQVIVSS